MISNKTFLTVIFVIVGLFILYRIFFSRNPFEDEYEKMYKEILTSDKHKVKGQYDKD